MGIPSGPLFRMSCGSASSSGSCSVAYPIFSGCGFLTFFVFSYLLPYIFLFSFIVFFLFCTVCCRVPVLMRTSSKTRHVGSCWAVLLALVSTLSLYGLVLRQLVSSYSRIIDIVWRGHVSLVSGIPWLSGVDGHCGIASHVLWFGSGFFIRLPSILP